ncbi:MAG: PKD domain-containing protein, partial [Solirubrobacteraceae bacterium]|nr:PKD domain-containing protein [Solirubrobacteraceae bacterium]
WDGNDDDPSDIDPESEDDNMTLQLDVDLAKCMRREPGAISGDAAGRCGDQIITGGDDDDAATKVYFRVLMSKSAPTAEAGGPYSTDEGADVKLDATASSDPDDDIETYAWDLDGDGACDDVADDPTPDFSAVGQDGETAVKLCVTDATGLTAEDTTTVTVRNVAPAVDIGTPAPVAENHAVTLTGSATDPGWLEGLTATIAWGDGAPAQPLAGTLDNDRPDAKLSFRTSHTYGDNGTYTGQVCAADDDTRPCRTFTATVNNTAPAVAIDLTGAVAVNGVPTVIAHAGGPVAFATRTTDPGSDDLALVWSWGDGTTAAAMQSLVNPPDPDPAQSPSIEPRDVASSVSHAFAGACAYEANFAATDDDGGTDAESVNVIIVGNGSVNRPHGFWKQQVRHHATGKGQSEFDAARLGCYLRIAGHMSRVFDERTAATTPAQAYDVLDVRGTSVMTELLDLQLLAAWLNFANGAIEHDRMVDTDGDRTADTPFLEAMAAAEVLRLNPNSTRAQLDRLKRIVESWTSLP